MNIAQSTLLPSIPGTSPLEVPASEMDPIEEQQNEVSDPFIPTPSQGAGVLESEYPANYIYYDSESVMETETETDLLMNTLYDGQSIDMLNVDEQELSILAMFCDAMLEPGESPIETESIDPIDMELEETKVNLAPPTVSEEDTVVVDSPVRPTQEELSSDDVVFVKQYKFKAPAKNDKQAKKSMEQKTPPRRNPRRQVQLQREIAQALKEGKKPKTSSTIAQKDTANVGAIYRPPGDLTPENFRLWPAVGMHEKPTFNPVAGNLEYIPGTHLEEMQPTEVEPKAPKRKSSASGRRKRIKTRTGPQSSKLSLAQSCHHTLHYLMAYSKSVAEFNRLIGVQKSNKLPDNIIQVGQMLSNACILYMITNAVTPAALSKYFRHAKVSENLDDIPTFKCS